MSPSFWLLLLIFITYIYTELIYIEYSYMKHKNTSAFTLTELIVVITILAILATIWILSFIGYTEKARNSSRISDMKTIEKALSIYKTSSPFFPLPDDPTTITFSGSLAWTQWYFWDTAIRTIKRISNIPTDPLLWVNYSYWVSQTQTNYTIGTILEGSSIFSSNSFIPTSYAISSEGISGYAVGDYIDYDIPIINGEDCSVLAVPSLLLSDIPVWWVITDGDVYNYVYTTGEHLPNTYDGFVETIPSWVGFQTVEVLDSCTINSISELDLYIAELSTAYQPLSEVAKYEELIFNSTTLKFKKNMLIALERHGINIDQSVIDELNSPLPERVFIDTFNDTDGTLLIGWHTPNSWSGSWSLVSWGSAAAYDISSNTLVKNGSSSSLVYPSPIPTITTADYGVWFDILSFGGGTITVYLRYTDNSNYYRLDIDSSGYVLRRMLGWTEVTLQNISEVIATGSSIEFSVSGDGANESVSFGINEVEKENILTGWGLSSVWSPVIFLQNDGATIDSYSLTYK